MTLKLATLYIILGSISFVACILTFVVLIKKFIDRPLPHCFFSYSDTIASALLSLALLLDGIIGLVPAIVQQSCYHFKLLNGLFVVAIVTGFFSVLGISIERFHMFAVVKDYSAIRRKFSIFWFLSSWTLSIVFVIILLPQIQDKEPVSYRLRLVYPLPTPHSSEDLREMLMIHISVSAASRLTTNFTTWRPPSSSPVLTTRTPG